EKSGKLVAPPATADFLRVWDPATGKQLDREVARAWFNAPVDSDAEFLKRVLTDVRGSGPTALELKYFTEDKDPKKREKLLDTLLKDPAVQKKLGDAWKKKMLAPEATFQRSALRGDNMFLYVLPDGRVQPDVL